MSNSSFFETLEPGSSPSCSSTSCSLNSSRSSPFAPTKKRKRSDVEEELGCDLTFEDAGKIIKKLKTETPTFACDEESTSFDWEPNQSGDLSEVDIFADTDTTCGSDSEKLTPMETAQKLIVNKWFSFDDEQNMSAKLEEIKTALAKIEKFLLYFNSWLGLDETQLLGSFLVLIDRIVQRMGRQPVTRYFDTFIVIALVTCKTFSEYKWKMTHFKSLWESISGWTGEQTGVTQEWWEYAEVQAFEVLDWNVLITNEEVQELLSQGSARL